MKSVKCKWGSFSIRYSQAWIYKATHRNVTWIEKLSENVAAVVKEMWNFRWKWETEFFFILLCRIAVAQPDTYKTWKRTSSFLFHRYAYSMLPTITEIEHSCSPLTLSSSEQVVRVIKLKCLGLFMTSFHCIKHFFGGWATHLNLDKPLLVQHFPTS